MPRTEARMAPPKLSLRPADSSGLRLDPFSDGCVLFALGASCSVLSCWYRSRGQCINCQQPFRADARNAWHQRYCNEPACRAANKAASQRLWPDKPENRYYFCGPEHVARTRARRQAHPGRAARAAAPFATSPAASSSQSGAASAVPVGGAAIQDLVGTQVVDRSARNDFSAPGKSPSARALQRCK